MCLDVHHVRIDNHTGRGKGITSWHEAPKSELIKKSVTDLENVFGGDTPAPNPHAVQFLFPPLIIATATRAFMDLVVEGLWQAPSIWSAFYPSYQGVISDVSRQVLVENLGGDHMMSFPARWAFAATPSRASRECRLSLSRPHGRLGDISAISPRVRRRIGPR